MPEREGPSHSDRDAEKHKVTPLHEQTEENLRLAIRALLKVQKMTREADPDRPGREETLAEVSERIERRAYRLRYRDLLKQRLNPEDAATQTALELAEHIRESMKPREADVAETATEEEAKEEGRSSSELDVGSDDYPVHRDGRSIGNYM